VCSQPCRLQTTRNIKPQTRRTRDHTLQNRGDDEHPTRSQVAIRRTRGGIFESLGNLAARSLDALALLVKTRLKRIVYRADLLKGFVEETGLEPP